MYTWRTFGGYNSGSKRLQWTRFAAAQKCIFRRPHSKIRDHWTWHNFSWKSSREKLKYSRCSSHWVEQLVQSNLFCWSLLWKVTIKVSEFITQNWSFWVLFCWVWGLEKCILSRRELGSLRSFGTAVVTPESTTCVNQNPRRLADESSIKWFNGSPIVNFPARIQKSLP